MASFTSGVKAAVTVLILIGFSAVYFGFGLSERQLGLLLGRGLLFFTGVVVSVLLFVWKVIPRWLVLLAWTILVVYLTVLVNPQLPTPVEAYLVVVLFGLFLILLGKWVHNVRSARRLTGQLDEPMLEEMRRVQRSIAGTDRTQWTRTAAEANLTLSQLDPATVLALQDLARLTHQIREVGDAGSGSDVRRILESVRAVETRMAERGVKNSRRLTMFGIAQFLVGGSLGTYGPQILSLVGL
jgi:Ca2+/Na+ antiporter